MENNKVLLTDLVTACLNFEEDPESKEKEQNVTNLLNQISVRSYLTIQEKEVALMRILSRVPNEYDAAGAATYVEIGKIIYGLLSYSVNLENDMGELALQYGIYDVITMHGIAAYFLQYCSDDFSVLEKMISDTLNFSNIFRLSQTMALFNDKEFDKWIKMITDLKTTLTPEMIKDLKSLAANGTPQWEALKKSVEDTALSQALGKEV